jgi:hypothetical protein
VKPALPGFFLKQGCVLVIKCVEILVFGYAPTIVQPSHNFQWK